MLSVVASVVVVVVVVDLIPSTVTNICIIESSSSCSHMIVAIPFATPETTPLDVTFATSLLSLSKL